MRTRAAPGAARLPDALAVGALALASRVPYLCRVEQDLDGSRFVRGVMGFDVLRGHPHPPGYPVFVGAAIALDRTVVHHPALALSLVSALAFAALCALTYALGAALGGARWHGALAALAFALGTVAAVHSTRPLSDMLGAALAWAVLACAARARPEASDIRAALCGAALFGALCGARLSVVPLALPAVVVCALRARRRPWTFALVALAAQLAWLAPLVATTGLARLVAISRVHAEGHFGPRGISLAGETDLPGRVRSALFGLWTHVLGGAWPDRPRALWVWSVALALALPLGAVAVARRARAHQPGVRLALGSVALYALWAFLAQNVVWQPRHLLPLAPACALVFALGVDAVYRAVRAPAARAALAVALAAALATLAREAHRVGALQARGEPPALRLARYLTAHVAPDGTLVATSQLATWLRFRAPEQRIFWVASADGATALGRTARLTVFATSEVPGVATARPLPVTVFAARGDRYVYSALYDLALLRFPADRP